MARVLIADSNPTFREHLRGLCRQSHDVVVVAEASDPADMLQQASAIGPDVVITGLTTRARCVFDAVRELKRRHPTTPVIVLSIYHHDEYALHALDAGASGFLMMEQVHELLLETVRMFVLAGSVQTHGQFAAI